MIKISVITCVFNNADTLAECVQSVLGQTYGSLELVVQDGGSNDGSLQLLHSFNDDRIKIESVEDDGIYDALNKALLRCTGDIIAILHADDFYFNKYVLSDVVRGFDDPCICGVYGDLHYVSSSGQRLVRNWVSGDFCSTDVFLGWMPPHPSLFLRRSVYSKLGGFDTSFIISGDYEFFLRMFYSGDVNLRYLPGAKVKMRVGGISNRSLKNIFLKTKEDIRAIKKYHMFFLITLFFKNVRKFHQFFYRRK